MTTVDKNTGPDELNAIQDDGSTDKLETQTRRQWEKEKKASSNGYAPTLPPKPPFNPLSKMGIDKKLFTYAWRGRAGLGYGPITYPLIPR